MKKPLCVLLIAVVALLSAAVASAQELVPYPADIVYSEPLKSVVFSHKDHLEKKGITCDSCHSKLFAPEKMAAYRKGDFTMKSFYSGEYCGGCHNSKIAFAANTECARCHTGVKIYNEIVAKAVVPETVTGPEAAMRFGSGRSAAIFQHAAHASLKCSECHSSIFPMKIENIDISMASINSGKFCGHCHNGRTAFAVSSSDCARCHGNGVRDGGTIAYPGGETGRVVFSHERHLKAGIKCDPCHDKIFGFKRTSRKMTMDMINNGKACGICHNGKRAFASDECGKCHQMS
jgi:c(7)-type cytochrome triheme protein